MDTTLTSSFIPGPLALRQILSLSREGLTAEQIAKELSIPDESVKLALASFNAGSEQDRDIDDKQLKALRKRAYDLAMFATDETIQARLTMFLIERDRPAKTKEVASNLTLINNAIFEANDKFKNLLDDYSK